MTGLIYVNMRKQVGDPEHLTVFADADPGETWLWRTMRHLFQGRASSASNRRSGV